MKLGSVVRDTYVLRRYGRATCYVLRATWYTGTWYVGTSTTYNIQHGTWYVARVTVCALRPKCYVYRAMWDRATVLRATVLRTTVLVIHASVLIATVLRVTC